MSLNTSVTFEKYPTSPVYFQRECSTCLQSIGEFLVTEKEQSKDSTSAHDSAVPFSFGIVFLQLPVSVIVI